LASSENTVAGREPVAARASRGRAVLPTAIFDRVAAAAGLVLLFPVWLAAAAAIALEGSGPVLFRQTRVGQGGRLFQLLKFRSMRAGLAGSRITAGGDARITRVGRVLRRYKLDELPQLWNVLRGDMSLVGPRPEIPGFVDPQDPAWNTVLEVKPGITDVASLVYRNEEEILAGAADPERYYRETVLPAKLAMNIRYLRAASFRLDLKVILWTVRYSFFPAGFDTDRVKCFFFDQGST
jgi:lipopolysaccharide/colanic/teichoic acid biosynthesis glycosyltransferase